MSREFYERTSPISLGDQGFAYQRALEHMLGENPTILDPSQPRLFVLGGFHPYNGTPQAFIEFCQRNHPNPDDTHVFLDINSQPLEALNPQRYPNRIQTGVENLDRHFKPESIDLLFMDCTLNFMNPDQARQFAQTASRTLSKNGLVLATIRSRKRDSLLNWFMKDKVLTSTRYGMKVFYYSDEQAKALITGHLKLSLIADFKPDLGTSNTLLALSRPDSPFSTHQGYPYYFERE